MHRLTTADIAFLISCVVLAATLIWTVEVVTESNEKRACVKNYSDPICMELRRELRDGR